MEFTGIQQHSSPSCRQTAVTLTVTYGILQTAKHWKSRATLLPPSGPHRACNGINLSLPLLLLGSTCFGQYYAHHQELTTIMLFTTLVINIIVVGF